MSDRPEDAIGAAPRRLVFTEQYVRIVPWAIGALLLIALAASIILMVRSSYIAAHIIALASLLILGLAGSGLVLLVSRVIRQLQTLSDQTASLEQRTAILAEQSVAQTHAAGTAVRPQVDPAELRNILLDIRETLLLPEQDRAWRWQKLVEREYQRRLTLAEQFIASRDFHRARAELVTLVERFGRDDRVGQAEDRLERASEAARAQDIIQISQRVQDLMGLARWDDAERAARELADKYPAAAEPANLLIRVQRERKLFEQRHRQRMHEEIQQLVNERRWRDAATATRTFIENFPVGVDTDALRAQFETLEANADIQSRQELERQLKQHVYQHQYWDALGLARRIITEHPLSPQANVLRAQIGRLEELARNQEQA